MKNVFAKFRAKRTVKMALVFVPVLIWDLFFMVAEYAYLGLKWVDDEGGKILDDFMES